MLFAALLVVLVVAVAGVLSMTDSGTPASSAGSAGTKSSKAATTPKPTTPTPSPSAEISIKYACTAGDKLSTMYSLKEVWAHPEAQCIAKQGDGGTPNVRQQKALVSAYGEGTRYYDKLADLYQLCASTQGAKATGVFVDSDAKKEMLAAYTLCVEHPNGEIFDRILAEDAAATEKARSDREVQDQEYANGLRVDEGNYLIGQDVQPGTWQSNGTKVTDCYWEISDAQGEIIANNFINTAPQFTITVPADASGFTVSGCSFHRIGD